MLFVCAGSLRGNWKIEDLSPNQQPQSSRAASSVLEMIFASLYKGQSPCSVDIVLLWAFSSILVVIMSCTSLQLCSALATVCTALAIIHACYLGVMQEWLHGKDVETSCRILCVSEVSALVFWLLLLLSVRLQTTQHIIAFFSPSFTQAIENAWKAQEPYISGPRLEFYESSLFIKMCEDAYTEADSDQAGVVDIEEFRDAVCNILDDPDWGSDDWHLSMLLQVHGKKELTKSEFVRLMKYACALRMEEGGYGKPFSYDFHVLQVPVGATMTEVEDSYEKLEQRFNPAIRHNVSDEEAQRDFKQIQDALEQVKYDLKQATRATRITRKPGR